MKKLFSLAALFALILPFASCEKEEGYPEVKSGFRINGKTVQVTSSYYDRDDLSKGHLEVLLDLENGLEVNIELDTLTSWNKRLDLTKPDPQFSLAEEDKDPSHAYWSYCINMWDKEDSDFYYQCWGGINILPACPGSYIKVTGGKEVGDPVHVEMRLMHVSLFSEKNNLHAATVTFKGTIEAESIGGE